jgi:plastocyanin
VFVTLLVGRHSSLSNTQPSQAMMMLTASARASSRSATRFHALWDSGLLVLGLLLAASSMVQAERFEITWAIPTPGTFYEDRTARVGDTIVFNWSTASHNVYIQPSGNCEDQSDEILVGQEGGTEYVIPSDFSGKTLFFMCNVGSHCERGMTVKVKVEGSLAEAPAPSPTGSSSSAWSNGRNASYSLLRFGGVVAFMVVFLAHILSMN